MKFDNVDNGDIHDMMGEREAAYGQEEDANLDVIEQLDSKIQEVEGENQHLRDKNSEMIRYIEKLRANKQTMKHKLQQIKGGNGSDQTDLLIAKKDNKIEELSEQLIDQDELR